MSWQLAALDAWLRFTEKPYLARASSLPEARARMERQSAMLPMPPGAKLVDAPLGAVPARRIEAEGEGAGVLLWLHGGAYCLGSPETHGAMVGALARRAGLTAVLPDYRLAPEHVFPAAAEDARAAWDALLAEGVPPGRVALGGDSAGGGLAFALLQGLVADGAPLPGCVVSFSPWVDLTLTGRSLSRLARREALLPVARIAEIAGQYLAGADPRDPRASPLFGSFSGAPPVLIQASRAEILLDDARRLSDRLRGDGVKVTLDLWRRTPHVWQFYAAKLPEADIALDRAAAFIASHVKCA